LAFLTSSRLRAITDTANPPIANRIIIRTGANGTRILVDFPLVAAIGLAVQGDANVATAVVRLLRDGTAAGRFLLTENEFLPRFKQHLQIRSRIRLRITSCQRLSARKPYQQPGSVIKDILHTVHSIDAGDFSAIDF